MASSFRELQRMKVANAEEESEMMKERDRQVPPPPYYHPRIRITIIVQ